MEKKKLHRSATRKVPRASKTAKTTMSDFSHLDDAAKARWLNDEDRSHFERLALHRDYRRRLARPFLFRQDRIPPTQRWWLRLSEIADHYARIPGTLGEVNLPKQREAIESLRLAILANDFKGTRDQLQVLNTSDAPMASYRLSAESASDPDIFSTITDHLWITRSHVLKWFKKSGVRPPPSLHDKESPVRIRAPRTTARSENACYGWLLSEMKKSPNKRPHPKSVFQQKAHKDFRTGTLAFRRAWDEAVTHSGSNWSQRGAPKKNKRNP